MRLIIILDIGLVCLVCMGYGRRGQTTSHRVQGSSCEEFHESPRASDLKRLRMRQTAIPKTLTALASLLAGIDCHSASWQITGHSHRAPMRNVMVDRFRPRMTISTRRIAASGKNTDKVELEDFQKMGYTSRRAATLALFAAASLPLLRPAHAQEVPIALNTAPTTAGGTSIAGTVATAPPLPATSVLNTAPVTSGDVSIVGTVASAPPMPAPSALSTAPTAAVDVSLVGTVAPAPPKPAISSSPEAGADLPVIQTYKAAGSVVGTPAAGAVDGAPKSAVDGLRMVQTEMQRARKYLNVGQTKEIRNLLKEPLFATFLGFKPGAARSTPPRALVAAGIDEDILQGILNILKKLDDFCVTNQVLGRLENYDLSESVPLEAQRVARGFIKGVESLIEDALDAAS